MLRQFLAFGLVAAIGVAALGEEKPGAAPAAPTNAGFEKMKNLVGTWVQADEEGKPTDTVVSVIKLTAGGSAIHETIFPGQPQEMISVYTVEGDDLVLTHYCMLGNQPRLKANPKSAANQIKFDCAGGANLEPKKDKHMHAATVTIDDADHLHIDGVAWDNGAPAKEMCCGMKLVRQK